MEGLPSKFCEKISWVHCWPPPWLDAILFPAVFKNRVRGRRARASRESFWGSEELGPSIFSGPETFLPWEVSGSWVIPCLPLTECNFQGVNIFLFELCCCEERHCGVSVSIGIFVHLRGELYHPRTHYMIKILIMTLLHHQWVVINRITHIISQ